MLQPTTRLMRIHRFIKEGELALTHLSSPFRSQPRTFYHLHTPPLSNILPAKIITRPFSMASDNDLKLEWTSKRVRDTFLQYFKENGHTFGKYSFRGNFSAKTDHIKNRQLPRLPLFLILIQPCYSPMLE